MSRVLRVDVYFDFICPWCLIGKRQLDVALAQLRGSHPQVEVELAWHGVQLLPHLPVEGVAFSAFYLERLGSAHAVSMRQSQVLRAANAAGVDLDLSRIVLMPNSADAHRLLACAANVGDAAQCEALLERLFAAYFQHGEDLGDGTTLLAIAESCGFEPAQLAPALLGDGRPYVAAQSANLTQGVPYFVFNNRLALSGAQPPEVLHAAMLQALNQNQERRA